MAIVWALEKWLPYLPGQRFLIETNHKPLEWMKSARDPRGKLARWALKLQEYDFTIAHIEGKENRIPDLLSREWAVSEEINGIYLEHDQYRMLMEQEKDTNLKKVKETILRGEFLIQTAGRPKLAAFTKQWLRLEVNSGGLLLYRTVNDTLVPVIPESLRAGLMEKRHQLTHTGVNRTYDMLRSRAYWPNMFDDIKQYVLGCSRCQRFKSYNTANDLPRQLIKTTTIGEIWSLDILGPFTLTTTTTPL